MSTHRDVNHRLPGEERVSVTPTTVLPIYLLIDLSDDHELRAKKTSVNAFVQRFVDDLQADPTQADRTRLEIFGFNETLTSYVPGKRASAIAMLPVLEPHGQRSYQTAFESLAKFLRQDFQDGRRSAPPLLIVLTDAEPSRGDYWQPAFNDLIRSWPGLTVRPIFHFDGHEWGDQLRYPPGPPGGMTEPAVAARAAVREYIAGLTPAPAPAADKPSERPVRWQGGFTPYSVGDPGNAARTVRPVPDPTEWDRRDTVLDGVEIRDPGGPALVHLRAASLRGLAHRYNGTVRQDEYAFRRTDDGRYLVAAVSDGVSNSRLSHLAAALIARKGCEVLTTWLAESSVPDLPWTDLVDSLSHEIVLLGRRRLDPSPTGEPLDYRAVAEQMAATALFGVVDLHAVDGEFPARVFAFGDSSGWVLRDGRHWQPLHRVKNSGDGPASSTTPALPTRPRAELSATGVMLRPGDVLVLMSDGVGDPLQDGDNDVGDFLAEMWREPPPPLAFAGHVGFARKSHDDDRTAVAIWAA